MGHILSRNVYNVLALLKVAHPPKMKMLALRKSKLGSFLGNWLDRRVRMTKFYQLANTMHKLIPLIVSAPHWLFLINKKRLMNC